MPVSQMKQQRSFRAVTHTLKSISKKSASPLLDSPDALVLHPPSLMYFSGKCFWRHSMHPLSFIVILTGELSLEATVLLTIEFFRDMFTIAKYACKQDRPWTSLWLQASCQVMGHILTAKLTFWNRLAASTLPGGTAPCPELNLVPCLGMAWEGAEPNSTLDLTGNVADSIDMH